MQVSLYKRETITETTKLPSSKALQVAKPQGPIYVTNVSVTSSLRNTERPQNLIGSSLVSLSHILTCILWSSERQNRLLFLRSFFVCYMQTTYMHDLLTLIQIVTCKLEENQYWYR